MECAERLFLFLGIEGKMSVSLSPYILLLNFFNIYSKKN